MATAHIEYSGAELARLLNVTASAVTAWKAEGCPSRVKSGRPQYVVHEVIAWRMERAAIAAAPLDEKKERLRKLKAEADYKEIEVAQIRGDLVPVALFEKHIALEHDRMRAALLKMPSTFAHLVADRCGCAVGRAQTALAEIADQTMTELQRGVSAEELTDGVAA